MPDLQTQFLEAVNARKRGNPRLAHDLFGALVAEHPGCHEGHYLHAMLAAELGDLPASEQRLRRALELDQGNPEYLFRLGMILHRLQRSEEAVEALQQADAEGEESAMVLLALGKAALSSVTPAKAEEPFRRLLTLEPSNLEGLLGLMSSLEVQNKTDEALEVGKRAVELHPSNALAHAKYAVFLERSNRLVEANTEAEAALRIDASEPSALTVRGLLHHRAERFQEAVADFRAALARNPSRSEAQQMHRVMGLSLDRLGRHDEAFREFTASKRRPEEIPAETLALLDRMKSYCAACRRDIRPDMHRQWATPPADNRPVPIFSVGFPRSGTTLLEQMLASHPNLVTSDEAPSLGLCTEELVKKFGALELIPSMLGTLSEPEIVRLRSLYWEQIDRVMPAGALEGKRLVDKLPLNTVNLYVARLMFPTAKVIVSLRDPRDVVLSGFMNLASNALAVVCYRSLEIAAEFYATVMSLWFHMRTTLGLEWMEIRYEDLIADTEGVSRRLIDFLGEPWDDAVISYLERTRTKRVRSASYQQVTEGIYQRAKGRWRAYEPHFGAALETLRPFAESLGYDPR